MRDVPGHENMKIFFTILRKFRVTLAKYLVPLDVFSIISVVPPKIEIVHSSPEYS